MKYCIKCGTKLADDDLFCGSCGAKQETVEVPAESKIEKEIDEKTETVDTGSFSESASPAPKTNNKRSKKPLIFAIGGFVSVCIVVIFAIFMFGNNKGLIALDDVEQKLNDAYIKVWEGYDIDFNGVTEFEIENVDEDTHDQTFSCFVMPSDDGVTGLRVMGLVKDGQVVQMQSIYVGSEDAFNQLDTDAQASILALVTFPISIFKEDVDTIQEFGDFLRNMDVVNDGTSGPDNMRTVDGDTEYTYMGGSGNGIVMSTLTIRYLPAFPTGFFEDVDNTPDLDIEETTPNETNTPQTNTPQASVSYAVYDEKVDEYRTALTMGSEAFDAKYDSGYDSSSINAMMVSYSYNYGGGISYATFDVDENGTNELIFSDGYNVIDIYTIHDGVLIKLFENCDYGDRSRIHVLTDGRLLTEGSSGASSGSCELYELDAATGKLSAPIGSYYCDGMGPSDYMTGYTYMSEDEYYDMLNGWRDEAIFDILNWTVIAENPEPDWGWEEDWDSGDEEVVYSNNGNIKLGSYSSTSEGSWDFVNLVELTDDNILVFNTGNFAGVALMNGRVGSFNITGNSPDDDGTQKSFSGTIAINDDFVTINISSTSENDIPKNNTYKYGSAYFFNFNSMYPEAFSSFTSTTLGSKYIDHQYLGTASSGMVTGMLVLQEDSYYYHEYDLYKVTQSDGVHYYALGWFGTENWTPEGLRIDAHINVYECDIDTTQITLNYITRFEHSW